MAVLHLLLSELLEDALNTENAKMSGLVVVHRVTMLTFKLLFEMIQETMISMIDL